MVHKRDITGQRFNRLIALRLDRYDPKSHQSYWIFQCDCGNKKVLSLGGVAGETTKSCGCYNAEVSGARKRTHGKSRTKVYGAWCKMKERCYKPNTLEFEHYGERGIIICDRWLESFENFLADMGEPPTPKHSIDRIDNDGNYEPGNCKWSTSTQQTLNYRRNLLITYRGQTKPLKMWTDELNLDYSKILQRIRTLGWSAERAFYRP